MWLESVGRARAADIRRGRAPGRRDLTVAMQKMPAGALVDRQRSKGGGDEGEEEDLAFGLAALAWPLLSRVSSLGIRARALVGARPAHPQLLECLSESEPQRRLRRV